MALPENLNKIRIQIEEYARRCGLDFFEVIFELLPWDQINMIAAYGGFPTRYPHWRFGMEYEELSKSYSYGLHRIYEMVINNDPCYAYLLDSNKEVDQKLVMAHVYAHCDFFKNNIYFKHTNRKMMDETANHATRIKKYMDKYGIDTVEQFIDICLSIDNLIDIHSPYIKRAEGNISQEESPPKSKKFPVQKEYMSHFINPREDEKGKKKEEKKEINLLKKVFSPQRDILNFLIQNAPLREWQQDVLSIIREEAYYFAPQGQTKIMNEGWATFWHSKIMTQMALKDDELIDYADHHSGTVAIQPGGFNPYKIGLELFRDIEDRWNKGRFGRDYEECEDMTRKRNWDLKLNQGIAKVFEVRKLHNDITFIDEFMTEDFVKRNKLFTFAYNHENNQYEIKSREFSKVKKQLLFMLTNMGNPIISLIDDSFGNRNELLLKHHYEGVELHYEWAKETLKNICTIWKRPIHLWTVIRGKGTLISFDGKVFSEKIMEEP
ncbi:MAG: SpoVR family protein [Deltaproteobacteria bacterium]|nr:SpoVR family protein [Deltaproteobacteria bacterium]